MGDHRPVAWGKVLPVVGMCSFCKLGTEPAAQADAGVYPIPTHIYTHVHMKTVRTISGIELSQAHVTISRYQFSPKFRTKLTFCSASEGQGSCLHLALAVVTSPLGGLYAGMMTRKPR